MPAPTVVKSVQRAVTARECASAVVHVSRVFNVTTGVARTMLWDVAHVNESGIGAWEREVATPYGYTYQATLTHDDARNETTLTLVTPELFGRVADYTFVTIYQGA